MVSYAEHYIKILDAGMPIVILAGEFDTQDGARGMDLWLDEVF